MKKRFIKRFLVWYRGTSAETTLLETTLSCEPPKEENVAKPEPETASSEGPRPREHDREGANVEKKSQHKGNTYIGHIVGVASLRNEVGTEFFV